MTTTLWIRPIFTGRTDEKLLLLVFHTKILTSMFSHTCTHTVETGWCSHNVITAQVKTEGIIQIDFEYQGAKFWRLYCAWTQFYGVYRPGVSHTLINTVCESKYAYARSRIAFKEPRGGGGGTQMSRGYQARPKIHVIRVVFQDQALYARTSFRGAKTCKIGKKGVFLVI